MGVDIGGVYINTGSVTNLILNSSPNLRLSNIITPTESQFKNKGSATIAQSKHWYSNS